MKNLRCKKWHPHLIDCWWGVVLHCHSKVYTALMSQKLTVTDLGHISFLIFQLFLYWWLESHRASVRLPQLLVHKRDQCYAPDTFAATNVTTQLVDLDRHVSSITVMDAVIPVLWTECNGVSPGNLLKYLLNSKIALSLNTFSIKESIVFSTAEKFNEYVYIFS